MSPAKTVATSRISPATRTIRIQFRTVHFQHHAQPEGLDRAVGGHHLLLAIILGNDETGLPLQGMGHGQLLATDRLGSQGKNPRIECGGKALHAGA
ncbi:MAG: hypothetical protein M1449_09625 [Candidatus Thermoplasmatota archaeon]|nr:hypothetical protein [Candidatus Thermoplasmatota archaeon]